MTWANIAVKREKVLILLFHRSMLIMEYLVMLKETGL